jgi:hypothetical protein
MIAYIESALFNGFLPEYIIRVLQWTALVSPSAYRVVIQVKPLNSREKRLPKNVLKAAYEIAKRKRRFGHTVSTRGSHSTVSSGSAKSRGPLFLVDQKKNFPQTYDLSDIQLLFHSIEQSSKAIAELTDEVQELRETTKSNLTLLNQMFDLLNKKNSDC